MIIMVFIVSRVVGRMTIKSRFSAEVVTFGILNGVVLSVPSLTRIVSLRLVSEVVYFRRKAIPFGTIRQTFLPLTPL